MVIPWVKIQWISDFKGYGLVASRPIPKGTVTFVQDGLDIVIPSEKLEEVDRRLREYVEKYSYEDFLGNRIISWDLGKYMNHDDSPNTLSTGYGFEIAIRDISEGEEITDDYRIFSTHHDTNFASPKTLEGFRPWPEELIQSWDKEILQALPFIKGVEQPLAEFVSEDLWQEIFTLESDQSAYRSVSEALPLRYKLQVEGLLSGHSKSS